MTPEGILTEDELPFDSMQGQRIVRGLRCAETYKFYRHRELQVKKAQVLRERRRFGDGAEVTLAIDPVLFHRIYNDPRFGPDCFESDEFVKDMRKWHPEFCPVTRHDKRVHNLGAIESGKPDKDAKYLVRASQAKPARSTVNNQLVTS